MFLKHRSDLASAANLSGWTCAHIAASKGSIAVIAGLLESSSSAIGKRSVISDINEVCDNKFLDIWYVIYSHRYRHGSLPSQ